MTDATRPSEPPRTEPKNPRPAVETHEGPAVAVEEDRPPPIREVGVGMWMRENLFSSTRDTVLTVVIGLALAYLLYRSARFVFVTGRWTIIDVNLTNLLVGRFPRDELWRMVATGWSMALLVSVWFGRAGRKLAELSTTPSATAGGWRSTWSRAWPFVAFLAVAMVFTTTITPWLVVLVGLALGVAGYQVGRRVPLSWGAWFSTVIGVGVFLAFYLPLFTGGLGWEVWGGLWLNLFATVVGIAVSFPIGIALALGRRSQLPGIRAVCVAYIELVRGVPLVTILLMGSFVIGFLLPPGVRAPSLIARGLIAIVAFTAAYVAEIVRGGLQSVPRGQVEAAQAVGLSPWKVTRLIVLPQALRNVIPALVGQFISLFKDTSLLSIIAIAELLNVSSQITSQPRFNGQGLIAETLAFAAFGFWVFAYAMSRESQRLEKRLGVGER